MLWCNNLKLENSHRTESGTESGRHIQLKFTELPFNRANFSSGNGCRASMGLLGVPWKAHDENRKGNKIKRVTVIMKPRKTYRSPLWVQWLHTVEFLASRMGPIWLDIWIIHTQRATRSSVAALSSLQHPYSPLPVIQMNSCIEAKYLISAVFHLCWPQLANDDQIPNLFSSLFSQWWSI